MARFVFRHAALLKQRDVRRRQCRADLARAMSQRNELQARLTQLQEEVRSGQSDLRQALIGSVDLVEVGRSARQASYVKQSGERLARELFAAEQAVQHAREVLTLARRDHRVILDLQERHKALWIREQQRREAVLLDDVAQQGWMRDQREAAERRALAAVVVEHAATDHVDVRRAG